MGERKNIPIPPRKPEEFSRGEVILFLISPFGKNESGRLLSAKKARTRMANMEEVDNLPGVDKDRLIMRLEELEGLDSPYKKTRKRKWGIRQ